MTIHRNSLLDITSLSLQEVESIFAAARLFPEPNTLLEHKVACFVFLEPSTRTRCSFEMAAHRLRMRCMNLGSHESSLQKGETLKDTLLNLDAMEPDIFVVRHGSSESLAEIGPRLKAPLINAGEGMTGHPTQALLDVFTLIEARVKQRGEFQPRQERVLFVGDIVHSRVAHSDFELLRKMNIEFSVCAPQEWIGTVTRDFGVRKFEQLDEALAWCTVCIALRVQRERHNDVHERVLKKFVSEFQLNSKSIGALAQDSFIMHPGPINHGVEMTTEILRDERSLVLNQVTNGVRIRGALFSKILGNL